jgi:hypothetical protein
MFHLVLYYVHAVLRALQAVASSCKKTCSALLLEVKACTPLPSMGCSCVWSILQERTCAECCHSSRGRQLHPCCLAVNKTAVVKDVDAKICSAQLMWSVVACIYCIDVDVCCACGVEPVLMFHLVTSSSHIAMNV